MSTFTLIIFLTFFDTGGTVSVGGFSSYDSCMEAGSIASKNERYRTHICLEVK